MDFERYALRVETPATPGEQSSTKAMSTLALLRDPTNLNLSEFLWRIGLPISALILALLAIPLSFVNPRASRSINLLFAVFTYAVYSNLISIVQAWVSQGRVSFQAGWWTVHAGMLGLLALLFYRRLRVGSLFRRR
jgi:lipopolysaccharide export system permease protein